MAVSYCNPRSESGAQLLARLSTRPDVTNIDPFIFGRTASSHTQVTELYGLEGSGKTELALHCVAKVCLPTSKQGIQLSGLHAKVVFIDTENKFSILRLAIILEKLTLETLNSKSLCDRKNERSEVSEDVLNNVVIKFENKHQDSLRHKDFPKVDSNRAQTMKDMTELKPFQGHSKLQAADDEISNIHTSSNKFTKLSCNNVSSNNSHSKDVHTDTNNVFLSSNKDEPILSAEDIEEIVQDSLSRVQVLRPNSSQHLLASLLSIETSLSEDPSYALLVIDSISAYYWLDRLASPTSYQHLDSRMVPIAKVLRRFSSEIGIACLITKSALFSGNKLSEQVLAAAFGEKTSELEGYKEYLGKIWSSINVKRILLTSTIEQLKTDDIDTKVIKNFVAYCLASDTSKCYRLSDDLLVPLK